jgi:hypothetical protein
MFAGTGQYLDLEAETIYSLVLAMKDWGSSGLSSLILVTKAPSIIPCSKARMSSAVTRPPEADKSYVPDYSIPHNYVYKIPL